MHEKVQYHHAADDIGKYGCQCNACHAEMEANDKHNIESGIDTAGDNQAIQRAFGVSFAPQNGGGKIICHDKRHAKTIHTQIDNRQVQHIFRCRKQLQQRPRNGNAAHHQQQTAAYRQQHRCVHNVRYAFALALSDVICYDNIAADGNADKQIDKQGYHRGVGAYRRQGFAAGKSSHHSCIHRIKQLLQHTSRRKRQGKQLNFVPHRAGYHVDAGLFFRFHVNR